VQKKTGGSKKKKKSVVGIDFKVQKLCFVLLGSRCFCFALWGCCRSSLSLSLSLSLSFSLFFFASTFCWVVVVVVVLMSSFFMRHFFCEIVCFGNISTGLILMQQIAYAILISNFFPHWNLLNAISVSV